jgi:hypothetical protein
VHLARKLLELKLIERKETKKAPSHSPDLGLFIRKSGTLIERDCSAEGRSKTQLVAAPGSAALCRLDSLKPLCEFLPCRSRDLRSVDRLEAARSLPTPQAQDLED